MGVFIIIYLGIGFLIGRRLVQRGIYGRAGPLIATIFFMLLWPIFVVFPIDGP